MNRSQHQELLSRGVHVEPHRAFLTPAMRSNPQLAMDAARRASPYAMDAVPGLVTTPSVGIPAYLANIIDPEEIYVILQPMNCETAYGSLQRGDWAIATTQFRFLEITGETAAYGDYSENGRAGHNLNFVTRESFHFQTFARYGEKDVAVESLAGINYVNEENRAAALVLAKQSNYIGFYGVAGIRNYGALNDPNLFAPITPTAKNTGSSTTQWTAGTGPDQVYNDFQYLFQQLQIQMGGNANRMDPITVTLSPAKEVWLRNTNSFGYKTAMELIEGNFPKLKIVVAPEMTTSGGDLMQMRLDKIDGRDTTYIGYTDRLRNHALIQKSSSWEQKKSAGSWGFICRYPIGVAQMLGI